MGTGISACSDRAIYIHDMYTYMYMYNAVTKPTTSVASGSTSEGERVTLESSTTLTFLLQERKTLQ